MVRALSTAAVALLLCGCRIDGGFEGTRYRCDEGGRCPAGQSCVAGYCETEPGGADAAAVTDGPVVADGPALADAPAGAPDGAAGDAAMSSPDAAVPPIVCGKATLLADDFADGVRAPSWGWAFASGGAARAETGGRLVITLADMTAGSSYAGYATNRTYDLTESRVYVEVPVMASTATAAQVYMSAAFNRPGPDDRVQFLQESGTLSARKDIAGTISTLWSAPWDATAHRWWQLRETGGLLYWETSPDGVVWTTRATDGDPTNLAAVRIEIGAGTWRSETSPGTAAFDHVNGGGPAAGVWCPAHQLTDDFADGVKGWQWSQGWSGSGCTTSEAGGQLTLTLSAGVADYCGYSSHTGFDLTGDAVVVKSEILVGTPPELQAFLAVEAPNGDALEINYKGGQLRFFKWVGGTDFFLGSVPYSILMHRWWRLREAGGMTYWETSPDGVTWTVRESEPDPFPLTSLDLSLIIGAETAPGEDASAAFDDFNLPP